MPFLFVFWFLLLLAFLGFFGRRGQLFANDILMGSVVIAVLFLVGILIYLGVQAVIGVLGFASLTALI